jgi:hypothetical protein
MKSSLAKITKYLNDFTKSQLLHDLTKSHKKIFLKITQVDLLNVILVAVHSSRCVALERVRQPRPFRKPSAACAAAAAAVAQ